MNKVTSTIKENHVKTIKELRKRISELEAENADLKRAVEIYVDNINHRIASRWKLDLR